MCHRAVAQVRSRYCRFRWVSPLPDTVGSLPALRLAGRRTLVLSNHVPELPSIIDGLDLGKLLDDVLRSATIGYETPHRETFRSAVDGAVARDCFIVGDNPAADVQGAERAGLRAIPLRIPNRDALRTADDVDGATELILESRRVLPESRSPRRRTRMRLRHLSARRTRDSPPATRHYNQAGSHLRMKFGTKNLLGHA